MMTGQYRRPIVAIAALFAGLAIVAPAAAAGEFYTQQLYSQQLHVSYKGLDLSNSADRATLNTRATRAIQEFCGTPAIGSEQEAEDIATCRADLRATLETRISAAVTAATHSVATR